MSGKKGILALAQQYAELLADVKQISSTAVAVWPAAIGGAAAGAIAGAISWRALRDLLPEIDSADQNTTNTN